MIGVPFPIHNRSPIFWKIYAEPCDEFLSAAKALQEAFQAIQL
jgi:hypothetical protein